jgi:uncharacterized secreted protein with C-terminal beta-propeller domain
MSLNNTFVSMVIIGLITGSNTEARKILPTYFAQNSGGQAPATPELLSFGTCQALKAHISQKLTVFTTNYDPHQIDIGERRRDWTNDSSCNNCGLSSGTANKKSAPHLEAMAGLSGPSHVVGTNNQVATVDEADFVKFDGKNIYQIHQGTLKIIKAWPANEMKLLSTTSISGVAQEMLVYKQFVVILASAGPNVEAIVIDVSNANSPRELTRFSIQGQYMTARLAGPTLRIAIRDFGAPYWRATKPATDTGNSWLESESTAGELVIPPTIQTVQSQRQTLDTMGNCENIYVPRSGNLASLTRLVTIDLEVRRYREALAFINPGIVYASENAVFLAEATYGLEEGQSVQKTIVHKFDSKKGESFKYAASGIVNGHVLNQFALDEYKGYLRVATSGAEFTRKSVWNAQKSLTVVNRVQVLKQAGRELKVMGKTENLASGERLYSVRFENDKGYLVTFRQVDPLFTLDLSNPYNPKAVGELKIPGFSTYIHILDEGHLLAIGQDADPGTGRAKGIKLSVFDTTDFKHPKEVKNLIFKTQTQSEATYEHKAFNFNREKGALAIPVTDGQRSALLLFKITSANIESKGELTMTEMFNKLDANSLVRRSFFADDIIYAVGEVGVKAARLQSPGISLGSVSFTQPKLNADLEW